MGDQSDANEPMSVNLQLRGLSALFVTEVVTVATSDTRASVYVTWTELLEDDANPRDPKLPPPDIRDVDIDGLTMRQAVEIMKRFEAFFLPDVSGT